MLNIVIPMAGAGLRFVNAGYTVPKPLIPVCGIPMIQLVIKNLRPNTPHRFIFICQTTHVKDYGLDEKLPLWAPGCELIEVNGLTEGAACTVLASKSRINNNHSLMISNSDQYIDIDIDCYLQTVIDSELDGMIMTMKSDETKWSYAGVDDSGLVTRVVEKQVISDEATVGIYNFAHGNQFVQGAEAMIAANERVNDEFYVAPVYNQLIKRSKRIGIYNVGSVGTGMYGLGIPADLENFLADPIVNKIALSFS